MNYFHIITNETKDPDYEVTNYIKRYLKERGRICTDDWKTAECILVLGGDGTLLRAATHLVKMNAPFLGINLGGLGFLAEVDRTGIDHALDCLMADEFVVEHRMMLDGAIRLYRNGTTGGQEEKENRDHDRALNDVVLLGKVSMQLIYFTLYVNGLLLHRYVADGMIVSTPTGSTGYNLSAGGPIVEPGAETILLTPLCPHSLHSRSIILSGEDEVVIEIGLDKYGKEQQVEVIFDGNRRRPLTTGDRVSITKSEKRTAVIKLSTTSFLDILHRKMSD